MSVCPPKHAAPFSDAPLRILFLRILGQKLQSVSFYAHCQNCLPTARELSAVLVELDAYLRLTRDGRESDQIRRIVESLKRKLDLIDISIQTRNLG
jgi:hypothetical protein